MAWRMASSSVETIAAASVDISNSEARFWRKCAGNSSRRLRLPCAANICVQFAALMVGLRFSANEAASRPGNPLPPTVWRRAQTGKSPVSTVAAGDQRALSVGDAAPQGRAVYQVVMHEGGRVPRHFDGRAQGSPVFVAAAQHVADQRGERGAECACRLRRANAPAQPSGQDAAGHPPGRASGLRLL